MHDWLVRFLSKVSLPSRTELLHVILLKFLLRGSNLHPGFDTICSERAGAIDIPLLEDLLLGLRVATKEVIKAFGSRLGTIGGKGEVMVLKIESDARKVNLGLYPDLLQPLRIADTRALEHKRSAERSARNDDLFAGSNLAGTVLLAGTEGLHWTDLYSSGSATIKDDFIDLSVAHKVEIAMIPVSRSALPRGIL